MPLPGTHQLSERHHPMVRCCVVILLVATAADALRVAVTGATGRTGRLVVEQALASSHAVTAIVRDEAKAKEVLPAAVQLKCLDLASADGAAMHEACADSDCLIWCATGFSDAGESLDVRGFAELLPSLDHLKKAGEADAAPTVIMLSSAG
eukprot:6847656-Prymnesium_polylepis.1